MESSNPALITNPFSKFGTATQSDAMTVRGTIAKTAILLMLVVLPAAWVWNKFFLAGGDAASVQIWMMVGLFGGLILAIATVFKANWSPITAPLYAVAEGLFLGGISAQFQQAYPGIVLQAVSLTMATLFVMLMVYQMGWIQATENFKIGVVAATGGIALVYIVTMVLGFFGIQVPFIQGSGMFSILFSLFVCAIAALNFVIDFDFIEQGARRNVPKYMEWYGAFALMVTLIWLYLEILRLLAKLNNRR